MQTLKDIFLFIASPGILLFVLISLIMTMRVFLRRQQHDFLKELDLMKSGFEQELFKNQLEIQEETFQHISLELHDNVGHFLSLAKLHLTTFKVPLPQQVTEKIDAANLLIAHSLEEIRNISKGLNTENIKDIGLIKTIQQKIEQLNAVGQFRVYLIISGHTRYLEDLKEIVLFRIIQESINNIVKHSRASVIRIEMHFEIDRLRLSVHDNGIGFTVTDSLHKDNQYSMGLRNIIKRSALINASAEILSKPNEGTTIGITTPYN